MAERAGFVGLGTMGSRMAANLVAAGFGLTVYNRTGEKAREWARRHGGEVAGSPAEVAAASDVVFTMLVDGAQVRAALLGAPDAPPPAAEGARPGALFVDSSTIGPVDTRAIGAGLRERGIAFVDAPVSGSSPKAADGTLTFICGGGPADVERAAPLLDAMGARTIHAGELGQGEVVKLVNNAVAAANAVTVGEALLAGAGAAADLDALTAAIAAGSGASAMLDLKAPAMRAHDFEPLFKLEHMVKDLRLCLAQAEAANVPFPAARRALDVLEEAAARGLGERDFAALIEALEAAAGRRL